MTRFNSSMEKALHQARLAADRGEVPVGAVVISSHGDVLAMAGNETRALSDPTAHAEVLAIRRACVTVGAERLAGASIYVTLEPCAMCAMAISHARIAKLYYGASDPKSGGVEQGAQVFSHAQCHHKPEVFDGIAAAESTALLKQFFQDKR